MRPDLEKGSLVLIDRNFAARGFLWDMHQDGIDFVVRAKHDTKVVRIRELASGDALVRVTFPWYCRHGRPALPKEWVLREIETQTPDGEPLRFFTSLLDPSIDGAEIAELYLRRWEEETAIDEIKTHLGDAATVNRPLILRSRKPQRVEQEIYGLLIAYNALRRIMVDAAASSEEQDPVCPLRLSFIAALERLREAVRDMMRLPPYRLQDRYADLLRAVARVRVPQRPGRSCPRVVRIKMSNYPLNRRRHAG